MQDNLLKCHVSWYSEFLRDDLKVPFGLNFIHPLFITTASSHSNKGWMLKIGFSKHLCSLQSNTSQKCSKVAGYILSENAILLLVTHNPLPLQLYLFLTPFVFLFPWTKKANTLSFLLSYSCLQHLLNNFSEYFCSFCQTHTSTRKQAILC